MSTTTGSVKQAKLVTQLIPISKASAVSTLINGHKILSTQHGNHKDRNMASIIAYLVLAFKLDALNERIL